MLDYKITEFDREVYEKELKSFLPDQIIDVHAHLYNNAKRILL